MKSIERIGRYTGPLYAATVAVSCVAVVALAIAGSPTH